MKWTTDKPTLEPEDTRRLFYWFKGKGVYSKDDRDDRYEFIDPIILQVRYTHGAVFAQQMDDDRLIPVGLSEGKWSDGPLEAPPE